MTQQKNLNNQKDVESLVKENLKKTNLLIAKVEELDKDFKKFEIMNFIRFLIVVIPVIFAILYLIPIFREIIEMIQPLVEFIDKIRNFEI